MPSYRTIGRNVAWFFFTPIQITHPSKKGSVTIQEGYPELLQGVIYCDDKCTQTAR
jgi:hypothetical protein